MAEKNGSGGIFAKLELDVKQKKDINEIEEKRLALESESRGDLDKYESTLDKMLEGEQEVDVSNLSFLDQGIERGRRFKGEISDLAESLTNELNDLGQFFGDMTQYRGIREQVLASVGLTRFADRVRMSRVKSADVKQNLQAILDYGHHMVSKLQDAIIQNVECHARLEATVVRSADKLEDSEPKYETWRATRERLESDLSKVSDKLDKAEQTQYAELEKQRNDIQKDLDRAKINENHYFTIVDKARKALPVQRTHLQAYRDLVDALTQFKTGLEEDIDHVTGIYMSAPTAIKTALGVKAASQFDKGMKYATDRATDTVLSSVKGVLDEAAVRAARPLIEPDKLDAYRKARREMRDQFDQRIGELKEQYSKPGAVTH